MQNTTVQTNWTSWFPERDQSGEIKPAHDVLQDASKFLREQLPYVGTEVRKELSAILRHRRASGESTVQTDEDLLASLNSTPLEQLSAYVDFVVDKSKEADADLAQKRSRGFHKRVARLQDFAVSFGHFLQAYSGIIDIVQTADAQFGNVAFAALSLLFATVKAKAEAEESICRCLLHISDRMPDFKIYQRIYPDPLLGGMLAEAYRGIILFAMKATTYSQAGGFVRYMRHFNGQSEFQMMEKELRENSNRISTRCETLLATKIDDLVKENKSLSELNDELLLRRWSKTLDLLNDPTKDDRDQNLKKDRQSLTYQFESDWGHPTIDARCFAGTTDGKAWDSLGSMLLLLFGRNASSSSISESWLSLIPIELAEKYFQSKNSTTYYERCTPSSTLERTLSRLILQLLENNPGLIRKGHDLREIDQHISRNGEPAEKVAALRTALLRVINLHDNRVYIILNRPDQCDARGEESLNEWITTMLSLVKETTAELKIMIVLRSELWDFEQNKKGVDVRGLDPNLFRPVRLDQDDAIHITA